MDYAVCAIGSAGFHLSHVAQAVLEVLKSLHRGPRPAPSKAPSQQLTIPSVDGQLNVRGKPATFGMENWLNLLGCSSDQIELPSCVHVAGTKGKGSTCAYVECLLRQHGRRTGRPRKTGLYTSPHLNNVQERIRINFEPLSEDKFVEYVSDVYQTLKIPMLGSDGPKCLQFLFLVSLHAFIQEGVEVAICETHHGGEIDATSIISRPLVTAITPIDRDHINDLGPTLRHVVWHKSGILKPGLPDLARILENRAEEQGVTLQLVDSDPLLSLDVPEAESPVQLADFSLACASWLHWYDEIPERISLRSATLFAIRSHRA
ncbi:folylpolyglutamate synthase [Teratosphaeria destructans]|uniref:Folylpolyglutamate synthase n=1 Tax=Teratosphaeria destructans TaxID=418781 RepID=A0A9W7W3Y7_9PEZI|nr:folylpolyglutamate synthase [Teratosphaeria destructans]